MSVLVNILTTYNGAGAKKAMRDMAVMQKQATLAGSKMSAGMLAASAAMQRAGAKTAAAGALMSKRLTIPVFGFAAASVYAAATVEKGLNRVRAGTGATGRKLDGLEGSFRKVAAGSGKDMETIGRAIADVNTRLGLTGKPLETVTAKFLTLSRVTGQDVTSMLTEVSKAANDAGVKSGEMAGFLDKLLVTSQQTGASISSLASDMYRYGSPLRQVGFGVSETMATLGAFDKAGVNTKLVMGSLRIALGKMAKAGEKDLPAGLAKGIEAIKNAKTGGDAAAKAIELFGARAGPDMAAAIREGRFEVADLIKQLEGSAGAVDRTGKATQTFSGKMAVLRNKATLAGEGFGLLLLPYLEKMVAFGGRVVAWLQGMDDGTRKWVMRLGLAVAAMGPALVVIGKLTTGIGRMVGVAGKLTMAFGKGGKAAPAWARGIAAATKGLAAFVRQGALAIISITRQAAAWLAEAAAKVASTTATVAHSAATKAAAAAQWLLNAAMSANPIGLIIAAVAGLVAVFVILWKKSDAFRNFWIGMWERVKGAAAAVWPVLKMVGRKIIDALSAIWDKVYAAVEWFWGWAGPFIKAAIKQWWTQIRITAKAIITVVKALWKGVSAAVEWFWEWAGPFIKGALKQWWSQFRATMSLIGSVVRTAWSVIKTVVGAGVKVVTTIVRGIRAVVDIIRGVWSTVKSLTSAAWDAVAGVVSGAWSRISGAVSSGISRVVGYVRSFADKLKGVLNLSKTLYSVGGDLVQGLKNGIVDAWHWVTDKLRDLVGSLSKAAKKALGINSPSRVFAEIGASVGEGLALGIRNGEAAARRASQDLAGSTVPAFGGRQSYAVAGVGGRGAVLNVLPGAVNISIGAGDAGDVTRASVDAAVDRGFRRLAAELGRR